MAQPTVLAPSPEPDWHGRSAAATPFLAFALLSALAGVALATLLLLIGEPGTRGTRISPSEGRVRLAAIWSFLTITLVAISAYSILQQVMALRLQDEMGLSVEGSIQWAGAAIMAPAIPDFDPDAVHSGDDPALRCRGSCYPYLEVDWKCSPGRDHLT